MTIIGGGGGGVGFSIGGPGGPGVLYSYIAAGSGDHFQAVQHLFPDELIRRRSGNWLGKFACQHSKKVDWVYRKKNGEHLVFNGPTMPTPAEIAHRILQERAAQPSRSIPNTMGYRYWLWDGHKQFLHSPQIATAWHTSSLAVDEWDESNVVRGTAGIHAERMPRDWKRAAASQIEPGRIYGTVERFGKYVLGEEGWRAEHVLIHELMAPDREVGQAIKNRYPEVTVHVADGSIIESTTEELPCISEESSKSESEDLRALQSWVSQNIRLSQTQAAQMQTRYLSNGIANQALSNLQQQGIQNANPWSLSNASSELTVQYGDGWIAKYGDGWIAKYADAMRESDPWYRRGPRKIRDWFERKFMKSQ